MQLNFILSTDLDIIDLVPRATSMWVDYLMHSVLSIVSQVAECRLSISSIHSWLIFVFFFDIVILLSPCFLITNLHLGFLSNLRAE